MSYWLGKCVFMGLMMLQKFLNSFCIVYRHGRKHTINPSNINYRANIWALKEEGCTHVISTTACGSLQENIRPGKILLNCETCVS